ncbi:MAG: endonuclease domain-containing protein [Thermoanaerobaculaceae bacterium]|nr:endonuclease domain-containing protein [Thermoanaerobaculaceae bacterium]MDI9622732.1 endonuclease domain-containing protein [Acidobacteriota bacterium]
MTSAPEVTTLERARRLRKEQTDVERRLWKDLRGRKFLGFKFRRQHPIGCYVVDFVCLEARVVVELDGGQHATRTDYDATRSAFLKERGFRVLRFWNFEVNRNRRGVLETVLGALEGRLPEEGDTPSP